MDFSQLLDAIWNVRWSLLDGVWITIVVSALSITLGTLVGLFVGLALTYGTWPLRLPARIYTDIVRGIPVLVLILAAFYISTMAGADLSAIQAGILALTIFCASRIAEIVRGALQAIPEGQTDAAKSIGLRFYQTLFFVLLPQAIRQMVPTWITSAVEIVKGSTLLSVIGVAELLHTSQQIISRNFMSLEFYFLAGLIYFFIDFLIESLGKYVDRRFVNR